MTISSPAVSSASTPAPVNLPIDPDLASFRGLASVVFLANFVDNALRMLVWLFVGHYAARVAPASIETYRSLVGVFYTVPWVLLSMFAGQLADKFPKRAVILRAKVAEVILLCFGAALLHAFASPWIALVLLALLATRTALFGPSTYGTIPEIMPEKRLSWANGWIDGLTFLGAILGVSLGGYGFDLFGGSIVAPILVLAALGAVGLIASLAIEQLPAAEPSRRLSVLPIAESARDLREIRETPGMRWAVAGIVAWWALAALSLQSAMKFAEDILHLNGLGTSRFFIYVGVGVALGSYTAGRISGERIELRLVPAGGFLMAGMAIAVGLLPPVEWVQAVAMSLVGFFAGWFIIPIKAFLQNRARPETRGGILGLTNFLTYIAMCVSVGGFYWLVAKVLGMGADALFLMIGGAALVLACVSLALVRSASFQTEKAS